MEKLLSFGPLFIVVASLLWSLDGLLRVSLYSLPPIVVVFMEHLVGFALIFPFAYGQRHLLKKLNVKMWGAFAWVTVLSSVLGTLFYTAALGQVQFAQFSVVVLLQQLEPLIVLVFARLVLKEPLSKRFIPWFITAIVAAYFISFPDLQVNWETGSGTVIAAIFAIAAAFSWGSSTVFSRYALLQLPTILTTAVRFGLASLLAGTLVALFGRVPTVAALTSFQWMTILTIALSTGMVALSIYYYGLKRTPARIATICELAWPLSAVAIDYMYFHKSLTVTQGLGALALLLTIYKVSSMVREQNETTPVVAT
ncbi:MAG: EamA family transporter [Candidatus Brocadia sp. WS118]|nr:MAG: EamA family transporter [Candidatus Brocadia sp. WS118]